MKAHIILCINTTEVEAEVDFDFIKGRPAYITGLPENCYPEEPDEWYINELFLMDDAVEYSVDASELIGYIEEDIISDLEEIMNE